MKILITGCAGYLGQILYPLLAKNHEVIGMDNFLYNQKVDFPVVNADITSLLDMYRLTKGVDIVIALAGIVGDPACALNEEETKIVNTQSTKLLMEVCEINGVKKVIFASSCSVYGASDKIITESSALNPLSLYAKSKIDAENILRERNTGELAILRFGTLYGYSPRMRFDLVVNIMTAMAVKEGKIVVNGGNQWRPIIHVEDVACTILNMVNVNYINGTYNIVTENYKIRNIAEIVVGLTGAEITGKDSSTDLRNYHVVALDDKFLSRTISLADGIMEIKDCLGKFDNYKDEKYYNVKILQNL